MHRKTYLSFLDMPRKPKFQHRKKKQRQKRIERECKKCSSAVDSSSSSGPLCVTADGASPNRKFFRMHFNKKDPQSLYKTPNVYSPDNRYLYFISDPPHLLKTVRNCWLHSGIDLMRITQFSLALTRLFLCN